MKTDSIFFNCLSLRVGPNFETEQHTEKTARPNFVFTPCDVDFNVFCICLFFVAG